MRRPPDLHSVFVVALAIITTGLFLLTLWPGNPMSAGTYRAGITTTR